MINAIKLKILETIKLQKFIRLHQKWYWIIDKDTKERIVSNKENGPYQQDIPLGFGFDILSQQKIDNRIFANNATYIIEEHSSQMGVGKYASSVSEYSEQFDVGGELSVSFGPISGSGSLSYSEKTATQQQNVFYYQQYTQNCGCVSLDQKWIDQSLDNDIKNSEMGLTQLRQKYGDYYVSNVCYGSNFKVEFTFSSYSHEDMTDLEGQLKGSIGWGPLSISAEVNIKKSESHSEFSMESELHVEARGFDTPIDCTFKNPETEEERDQLMECVTDSIEALSNSCTKFDSGRGKSLDEVYKQKGKLWATAVTLRPISDIEPFSFSNDKYDQLKAHIDMGWAKIRFLHDFTTSLEEMMAFFTEHVLSEITDIDTHVTSWQKFIAYDTAYKNTKDTASGFLNTMKEYMKLELEEIWETSPEVKVPSEAFNQLNSVGKLIDGIHEQGYGMSVFRGIFVEIDGEIQPFYGSLTISFDIVSKVIINDKGLIELASLCNCGETLDEPEPCFLVPKSDDRTMLDGFDLDILKKNDYCILEDKTVQKIVNIDPWSSKVDLENGIRYEGKNCRKDPCPSQFMQVGTGNSNNFINEEHRLDYITSDDNPEVQEIHGCYNLCINQIQDRCRAFVYDEALLTCTLGTKLTPDGSQGEMSRFCAIVSVPCSEHECKAGWLPKPHEDDYICGGGKCSDEECCVQTNTCASMECPNNWVRKSQASETITCDQGTCNNEECCDSCHASDIKQEICKIAYGVYLIECFGTDTIHESVNFEKKMQEDCTYCHRWDELRDTVMDKYGPVFEDWPADLDLRRDCKMDCGTCMPEEDKCYDTDTIVPDAVAGGAYIAGDKIYHTCADYYNTVEKCEESWKHATAYTDGDRDCCACGGGRIGPKCPKEFPYWGSDKNKYWTNYICWKDEKAATGSTQCGNWCIRGRNVNLDRIELNKLHDCGPFGLCPDDSTVYDCSKMTATIRNKKTGAIIASLVQAYSDVSGRKCIFDTKHSGRWQMVAIHPETCAVSAIGHLNWLSNDDVKCHDSHRTGCWHRDWTNQPQVTISNIDQCKGAIRYCPVGDYNKCGPKWGFCAKNEYCNEETELCDDLDNSNSSGEYDLEAYKNCLAGQGYAGDTDYTITQTANGKRYQGGFYLDIFPMSAKGCYRLVLADSRCSNTHFSWASNNNFNCWCVPAGNTNLVASSEATSYTVVEVDASEWIEYPGSFLTGYANGDQQQRSFAEAKKACRENVECVGITCVPDKNGLCTSRKGPVVEISPTPEGEVSYTYSNSFYKSLHGQYCPQLGEITHENGCKAAARALGLPYAGTWAGHNDWHNCVYRESEVDSDEEEDYVQEKVYEVYFNSASDASPVPNNIKNLALCVETKCVPYSQAACEAAALKEGLELGTAFKNDFIKPDENSMKGCWAAQRGLMTFPWILKNRAFYNPLGTVEEMASPGGGGFYRPHGYDCFQSCPEQCYGCRPEGYEGSAFDIEFVCTQFCAQKYGTDTHVCYHGSEYRYERYAVDCTQCTPVDNYMGVYDDWMVAAPEEDTTNGFPYGKFIIFAALAFGVGYGYSKYRAGQKSKYLPLVADNI